MKVLPDWQGYVYTGDGKRIQIAYEKLSIIINGQFCLEFYGAFAAIRFVHLKSEREMLASIIQTKVSLVSIGAAFILARRMLLVLPSMYILSKS